MNSDGTISWPNFLRAARLLAKNLDDWSLIKADEKVPGGIFLKYSVLCELSKNEAGPGGFREQSLHNYHIVYSVAHQVPVLYFNVYLCNGCQLQLKEILFNFGKEPHDALTKYISQEDHPILNTPYYVLHPCHTDKIMEVLVTLRSSRPISYIASWLHLVSTHVGMPPLGMDWYNKFVLKPFVPTISTAPEEPFFPTYSEKDFDTLGSMSPLFSPPDSPVEPDPEEFLNLSPEPERPLEFGMESTPPEQPDVTMFPQSLRDKLLTPFPAPDRGSWW